MAVLCCQIASAAGEGFTTKGDGTTYTIEKLSSIAEANMITWEAEDTPDYMPTYEIRQDITIAEGDRFVMDEGIRVLLRNGAMLTIKGEGDLQPGKVTLIDGDTGGCVRLMSATTTEVANCTFHGVGLEMMGAGATNVRHCQFREHDGATAAALYFIQAGAASSVEDCHFEGCRKAAIGSAANAAQPLTIKDCTLVKNSTANGNVPQINITAAKPLTIKGCTVTGNPEHTMVGGIGISNFMSYEADVTIEDCTIEDNRYGIGLVGPAQHISIAGCTLLNNRYETNPMNGGSGISLYDPYQLTHAVISNNHIEGSLWGVTIIGCQQVNLGCLDKGSEYNPGGNVFKDNGNGGELYDLYNNSTLTVMAQNNTWNVAEQTQEEIEKVIFHKADNAALGEVVYWPAASSTGIAGTTTRGDETDGLYYDLNGAGHKRPVKGINIRNGRKVVR